MASTSRSARRLAYALLVCVSLPAVASDGLIEINQATALAGGINGDLTADPPGFPVHITQPGSYRLTGNLSVLSDTTAIRIDAVDVTLDLGGFQVSGPNTCAGYPPTTTGCTLQDGAPGIWDTNPSGVVRNGSVTGMGGTGVQLSGISSQVDHVRVRGCGGAGIYVLNGGRVTNSYAEGNYRAGIAFLDGSEIRDNEVRGNLGVGISQFWFSEPRLTSSVSGNRAFDNGSGGIAVTNDVLVSRNVASGNTGFQITGGGSLGDNLCGASPC